MNNQPVLWAELTWEQMRDVRADGVDMAIFPVGSIHQNGPHLPLGTATTSAEIVAHAVSARTGIPVLPTLPFGCAQQQTRHWPGTLSLSPQTFARVIEELLGDVAAYGFTRILVLSGHVGNAAPLRCALENLRIQIPDLQIACKHLSEASPRVQSAYEMDAADWHAGAADTALMMHLAPQLVRTERIFDDPDRTRDLVFSYTVPQTSLEGHTGNPTAATPERGAELFETLAADWTRWVKRALIERAPIDPNNRAGLEPAPAQIEDESLPDALFGRPS